MGLLQQLILEIEELTGRPGEVIGSPMKSQSGGCHGEAVCERHQIMRAELARRYSAKSSTALENASNPSSTSAATDRDGTDGPR